MVYNPAKFKSGSVVRIANRNVLEGFMKTWKLHHQLESGQLKYAGKSVKVGESYMYHGGDIIYKLEEIPGLWHEHLLEAIE